MLNSRHALSSATDEFLNVAPLGLQALLKHVSFDEIPRSVDLLPGRVLEEQLSALSELPPSVIVVGDIMLGGRAKKAVVEFHPDAPVDGGLPLLRIPPILLGNCDGR